MLIPQYVIFQKLGLVNTFWPLILPKFLATDAFFVFLMVQFIRSLPRELDEAATIDGCGPFRTFRWVILPLLRPAIITTAIFTFIWTWNDFFAQLIYLNTPGTVHLAAGVADLRRPDQPVGVRPDVRAVGVDPGADRACSSLRSSDSWWRAYRRPG